MQNRAGRCNVAVQRSLSSPRATVASGNERTPSFVGVYRNASLRETSLRQVPASWSTARQTSSASSSPSPVRRPEVTASDGCLATAQVRVTRASNGRTSAMKSAGGSVGRSATLPAGRASMLPTATHSRSRPAGTDNSPSRTNVQQRLKVKHRLTLATTVRVHNCHRHCLTVKGKTGKGFPYSLPSVGPGADPGVQAVSLQVTISHTPRGRLPLLSARPSVAFPAAEHHRPLSGTKLYCLVTEAHFLLPTHERPMNDSVTLY